MICMVENIFGTRQKQMLFGRTPGSGICQNTALDQNQTCSGVKIKKKMAWNVGRCKLKILLSDKNSLLPQTTQN